MFNLDFGTDWGNAATQNFLSGNYLLGTLQEINGMVETAVDFGTAYLGATALCLLTFNIKTESTSIFSDIKSSFNMITNNQKNKNIGNLESRGGIIKEIMLEEDTTFYRVYSGNNTVGNMVNTSKTF